MSDIKFTCPHCNQNIEAPEDMGGEAVECPSCKGAIQVPRLPEGSPAASPPRPQPPVQSSGIKARMSALWKSGAKGKAVIIGGALILLMVIGALLPDQEPSSGEATTRGADGAPPQPEAGEEILFDAPPFKDQEPEIRKDLAAVGDSHPNVKRVASYDLDFPKQPFQSEKANVEYEKILTETRAALNAGTAYEIKQALKDLKHQHKWAWTYDEQGRTKRLDETGLEHKQSVYGPIIKFVEPLSEQREKETTVLKDIERKARDADRDPDKLLALVPQFVKALEDTACPYKVSEVHYFISNETFPFWQFPWMVRLKANALKKEQWEHKVEGLRKLAIYNKYKDARAKRVTFKDVIFDPQKYKGKVLESDVHIAGGAPVFYPLFNFNESFMFDTAPDSGVFEKCERASSSVGKTGRVRIKYWCNGKEGVRGVLLDVRPL